MRLKNNFIKILSLALGLAIGMVLIAKVCFELSYDGYFSDPHRVYMIKTGLQRADDAKERTYGQISGGVAPGFKEFVPGVEAATRATTVFDNDNYYTEDNNRLKGGMIVADTSFFEIIDRPVLSGDPVKILSQWGKAMVARSFAEKMGGVENAIGKTIYNESMPNFKITVEGVYEDFPQNSSMRPDILLSMESYNKSSTENWVGNDRYRGFVKLAEGVDPASLADAIHKMQEKNQPLDEFEQNGMRMWYFLERADKQYISTSEIKSMIIMLSIVAFLLIAASVVNFIFNAVASVAQRAKEIGVRKCYGAESSNIMALLFKETALMLLISIALAIVIIGIFSGVIEQLLGTSIIDMLMPQTILLIAAVCVVAFLVSAYIPARIFMGIPVTTAFKAYKESKRRLKLTLLTIQFSFTIFLVCIVAIFGSQYNKMINEDLGYNADNLMFVDAPGTDESLMFQIKERLEKLPQIEGVALVSELPFYGSSGNNVSLPNEVKELFNIADQYCATPGAAKVLGLEFIEGREPQTPREIAVSRSFVEKMNNYADWSKGAIGEAILMTEHSDSYTDVFTISGVYEDYKIGSVFRDNRPSVRFMAEQGSPRNYLKNILIRVDVITPQVREAIEGVVNEIIPDNNLGLSSYKEAMRYEFNSVKRVKDSILFGGIFSLIISIIGLIGYIKDETQRRSAEMAIRKINGAQPGEIVGMFIRNILILVAIAAIIGSAASYYVGDLVLQYFSDRASITFWLLVAGNAVVIAVVLLTVILNSIKIANANPVESLKDN